MCTSAHLQTHTMPQNPLFTLVQITLGYCFWPVLFISYRQPQVSLSFLVDTLVKEPLQLTSQRTFMNLNAFTLYHGTLNHDQQPKHESGEPKGYAVGQETFGLPPIITPVTKQFTPNNLASVNSTTWTHAGTHPTSLIHTTWPISALASMI